MSINYNQFQKTIIFEQLFHDLIRCTIIQIRICAEFVSAKLNNNYQGTNDHSCNTCHSFFYI
jgi:hypothetical protein